MNNLLLILVTVIMTRLLMTHQQEICVFLHELETQKLFVLIAHTVY